MLLTFIVAGIQNLMRFMIKICERISNKNEQINQSKDKIELHLTHPTPKQKARLPHAISLSSCPRQVKKPLCYNTSAEGGN
jgi:hypothetical protein